MLEKENNEITSPQVFINQIEFNDTTKLSLNHNSVVVFTGPNNCGKSLVLRDIEKCVQHPESSSIVVRSLERSHIGEVDESFLSSRMNGDEMGRYWVESHGRSLSQWSEDWVRGNLSLLANFFISRLDTKERLLASESKQLLGNSVYEKRNSLHKVYEDDKKEAIISSFFFEAFNEKLVVNRRAGQFVSLHIGSPPDRDELKMSDEREFYHAVARLPKLDSQGDGMRSFASILLDNFTSNYSATLIDEPEAFLHPPQARLLGKMLAKHNPNERQLFISTHSQDFLQGLLDAENDNVTIIRINRKNSVNHMSLLDSESIKKLWSNPILKYTNILSGLFHAKVVVCESDYDCLFYQAVMNAMCESHDTISPDILFTHCGGKDRIKDVVSALVAVNVPVAAICDFDLLNDRSKFKAIISAFGAKWEGLLSADMKVIYDSMNIQKDSWAKIKRIGKAGFNGDAPAAYEAVESACKKIGLFIVPVGEMECFDKTINKEKREWVYHVLENSDLSQSVQLSEARTFIQSIVEFIPSI